MTQTYCDRCDGQVSATHHIRLSSLRYEGASDLDLCRTCYDWVWQWCTQTPRFAANCRRYEEANPPVTLAALETVESPAHHPV